MLFHFTKETEKRSTESNKKVQVIYLAIVEMHFLENNYENTDKNRQEKSAILLTENGQIL